MKVHEARLKGFIHIGSFRSTGEKDPSICGDNCEVVDIIRINPRKLDIKCRYIMNNNEQSQTIKALSEYGEKVLDSIEKSRASLIDGKISDIHNLEIDLNSQD